MDLDFSRLEENICEVVIEEQIKLGYRKEKIHLYYPLRSLNRILGTKLTITDMFSVLEDFCTTEKKRWGDMEISNDKERFCFTLPPEAVEYIHQNDKGNPFLEEFIGVVKRHGCSMEEVFAVFFKYSDQVHIEKVSHGEFDYLVYFENGIPDSFRYCLTDEGHHVIYHRFTAGDYEEFTLPSTAGS